MSPCEHTLFEGLLISGIYSRYAEMAKKAPDFRWIFLNTSLETCLENTRKRRIAAGKPPAFNPDATINKYKAVQNCLQKARADGFQVWNVSSDEAVKLVLKWLK